MTRLLLRGRAAEQAAVRRAGRGVVIVVGEPGIGRTALLRAEVAHASGDGYAAYAAARPDDAIAPLATLAPAVRPLMSADAFRGLADLQDKPLWLAERLASVLAAKAPALIAVDDVQWADPLSAFLLRTLPIRLAGTPVRWLLAGAPSFPGAPLSGGSTSGALSSAFGDRSAPGAFAGRAAPGEFGGRSAPGTLSGRAAPGAFAGRSAPGAFSGRAASGVLSGVEGRRIELGPLDSEALAAIAADRLGRQPDAALRARLCDAGGLPYLAVRIIEDDGPGLRDDVRRRLVGATERCRALVTAAAVLGETVRLEEVAMMLGEQAVDLIGPLGEAIALGLLADGDDGLVFRHDLVRGAVLDDLTPSARRALQDSALDLGSPAMSTMDEELSRLLDAEAPRPEPAWDTLTAMEQRVATLISDGHTNRAAAAALHLSPSTVSTHLRAVFAKLGINSRVQLTRLAMRRQPT